MSNQRNRDLSSRRSQLPKQQMGELRRFAHLATTYESAGVDLFRLQVP